MGQTFVKTQILKFGNDENLQKFRESSKHDRYRITSEAKFRGLRKRGLWSAKGRLIFRHTTADRLGLTVS